MAGYFVAVEVAADVASDTGDEDDGGVAVDHLHTDRLVHNDAASAHCDDRYCFDYSCDAVTTKMRTTPVR